jgi:hypothetical protein
MQFRYVEGCGGSGGSGGNGDTGGDAFSEKLNWAELITRERHCHAVRCISRARLPNVQELGSCTVPPLSSAVTLSRVVWYIYCRVWSPEANQNNWETQTLLVPHSINRLGSVAGRNVSPVRYELDFYMQEDDILHSHRRENLKSYSLFLFSCV